MTIDETNVGRYSMLIVTVMEGVVVGVEKSVIGAGVEICVFWTEIVEGVEGTVGMEEGLD